jgi:TonB family protein
MTAALIYKPAPRWPLCVALASAALIHLAAVAMAGRSTAAPAVPVEEDWTVNTEFVTADMPPAAAAPIDELSAPPPPVVADPFMIEPDAPPRRVQRASAAPARPLVRPTAPRLSRTTTMSGAKVMAISAPRPEYPYEARRQRTTGSGVAVLTVDFANGNVLDVAMVQSTGSAVLDQATISGFRRWRFKPGTVSRVQSPITFTFAGASY